MGWTLWRRIGLCLALLLASSSAETAWCTKPPGSSEDEEAARALVEAALESEMAGDAQRRQELLDRAVQALPEFPPANWHLGRVQVDGRWVGYEEAVRLSAGSERLMQYYQLRDEALGNAKRERILARWCARTQLEEESRLHYTRLLQADTADAMMRAEAMRVLRLRNVGGRFASDEDVQHTREVAKQLEQANTRWRPQLLRWQTGIDGGNERQRSYAIERVEGIDDPHVVPVLKTLVFDGGPKFGEVVVGLTAKFPQYEATHTLVYYAVLSRWPTVRQEAIRQLKRRPLHEYVPLLLGSLASPIQTRWSLAGNAFGAIQLQHAFYREGPTQNFALGMEHQFAAPRLIVTDSRLVGPPVERFREDRESFSAAPLRFHRRTYEFAGYDNVEDQQELAVLSCLVEAHRREEIVGEANGAVSVWNEPLFVALEETTGRFHNRAPAVWWDWWEKYNEVHSEAWSTKPTSYLYYRAQLTNDTYTRALYQPVDNYSTRPFKNSCFPAGTIIWTQQGMLPIETIKIGDRVLSQDPDTGELAFKLVLKTTLRPPSAMIRITVDGEDIVTTLGHPVWVSEKRWRMAKLLEVGDQLHGVAGISTVEGIDNQVPINEAHNLVVAGSATYFVGEKGILVHDNTYRAPTRALVPGLLPRHDRTQVASTVPR